MSQRGGDGLGSEACEGEWTRPLCRSKPRRQWCDWKGPGDFMGHTCGTLAETWYPKPWIEKQEGK
jgi:hypothetical protein